MNRNPTFRWGLLGAGTVARHFARSVCLLPDHKVVAVASRSLQHAEALGGAIGAEKRYDDFRALVEDGKIDAIYVATPSSLHKDHVELALRAKKAVLCEKPFAVSGAEAQTMAELAKSEQVFCMEAMWMRFIPIVAELKALVENGEVGDIRLLQADLGFAIPFAPEARHFDPSLGGGSLLDLGVYPLSLAWYLLGAPSSGFAASTPAETGVDEQMVITLAFSSGAVASLACSFCQRLRNCAYIVGSQATITVHEPLYSPSAITITRNPPPRPSAGRQSRLDRLTESLPRLVELRRRHAPKLRRAIRRNETTLVRSFPGFGYQFEAAEVARCVRDGRLESARMPLRESVEIMKTVDQLLHHGRF